MTLILLLILFWFILAPTLILLGLVWLVLDIMRKWKLVNIEHGDTND